MSNSSALDIEAIKGRAGTVSDLESQARTDMRRAGLPFWPLGDAIKANLADVQRLLARVEELEAALAKREPEVDPLRSALIGILRADGYIIHEPAWGEGSTVAGVPVVEFHDPRTPTFNPDAAASDMLGEDACPDSGNRYPRTDPEDAPNRPPVCPNCEQPLPPDGKCRSPYVDCQKASAPEAKPLLLEPGDGVCIVGGEFDGRHAVVRARMTDDPPTYSVDVCLSGLYLAETQDVPSQHCLKFTQDEPMKTDTPAAKPRQRAPEPPKLVTEWAPDGRDFEGYAKDLGITVDHVKDLEHMFKVEIGTKMPDMRKSRWGGAFKDWAKARLANQT